MTRSSPTWVTVKSHSMPPRRLSIWVYVTLPVGRSIPFAHSCCKQRSAPGPLISIVATDVPPTSPARPRVARCSAAVADDQCLVDQPPPWSSPEDRGGEARAFVSNELGRSRPDFSPTLAPSSLRRG